MCGIVGYIGPRDGAPIVINGLRKLEYRGYDSAGVAVLADGRILVERAVGKLGNLERKLDDFERVKADGQELQIAMGHTRWATHGGVTESNAHPHVSMDGKVAVVHNGIVENFIELKRDLQAEGVAFNSETDTEVIVQLVERYLGAGYDFEGAAHETLKQLRGSQAVVLISLAEPDKIIAARLGNAGGISIGLGEGETLVASDIPAILEHTRKIIFLDSQEVAALRRDGCSIRKLDGAAVKKEVHTIAWDPVAAEKGEYRHFMQKEIAEQARAVTDTLRGRVDFQSGAVTLENLEIDEIPSRIYSIACGTSWHSALVGKFMLEMIGGVPTEVEYGSEFRYREPIIIPNSVALGITQSGETADTLAEMQGAKERGATLWSIVNTIGSQATRVTSGHIIMRTGPEICVASTKAFTTSMVDQYVLACAIAQARHREQVALGMKQTETNAYQAALDLAHLPGLISRVLEPNPIYDQLADLYHGRKDFLYLARGINYPIALEGALKLKEISYIHAEGYPAGEMKHGPIALIDEQMPVVCIAVKDGVYEKMVSQIEQVKARKGIVIAVATEGDEFIKDKADHIIWVPPAPPLLTPILTSIPMQLIAYHIAVRLGCDVDQPRNLAKSVTVE